MKSFLHIEWQRKTRVQTKPEGTEQGQSLLEMAFTLPILLLVLVAIIDFGRAFDAYIVITNAVREGARYGSREPSMTLADIQEMVAEDILGSGTNVTAMADFETDNVDVEIGTDAVTVTVTYDFDLWFGGFVGMEALPLEKQSVMPILRTPGS